MTRPAVAVLVLVLALSGCVRPTSLGGNPDGVWIKEPVLSIGSPDSVAQAHCERYGKSAVRKSRMVGNEGDWRQPTQRSEHMPIHAYDCK